ncbi:hypothetical protein NDU88_007741 [Pleurodeles waltl]|uniref:Uncharacterized protein n=1 Tax=Pleurodeles waltl TaxID=8319 RepID=A0AAV7PQV5_PLEWA|nr:hypothetical protein NDU88_007741 [Pleurodeles waltl]
MGHTWAPSGSLEDSALQDLSTTRSIHGVNVLAVADTQESALVELVVGEVAAMLAVVVEIFVALDDTLEEVLTTDVNKAMVKLLLDEGAAACANAVIVGCCDAFHLVTTL